MTVKNIEGMQLVKSRHTAADMEVGERGFIAPWSVHIDIQGNIYLDVNSHVATKRPKAFLSHIDQIEITKMGLGDYELDFKLVERRRWLYFTTPKTDDLLLVGKLDDIAPIPI